MRLTNFDNWGVEVSIERQLNSLTTLVETESESEILQLWKELIESEIYFKLWM